MYPGQPRAQAGAPEQLAAVRVWVNLLAQSPVLQITQLELTSVTTCEEWEACLKAVPCSMR